MTVTSVLNVVRYLTNGLTTFDYPYKILNEDQLEVIVANANDDESSRVTLVLNTDYTVSGVGEDEGGSIELAEPVADETYYITINRSPELTQETDYEEEGDFSLEQLEEDLDAITIKLQFLQEQLNRCPKVSVSSGESGDALIERIEAAVSDAESFATLAELANTSAVNAQDSAETAQDFAEAAQLASEAAADSAEAAQTAAANSVTLAQNAQSAAEAARDLSIAAKDDAVIAQGLAEDAQDGAETAGGLAVTAQGLAEAARDAAQGYASDAEGFAVDSEQSAMASESARDSAVIAQGLAETAQGLAEDARDDAEAAADLFPVIQAGDAGKSVIVNETEDGYVLGEGSGSGFTEGDDKRCSVITIDGVTNVVDTDYTLYNPAAYAVGVKVNVINLNTTEVAKIRVANRAAALANKDYCFYDISIQPNQSVTLLIPGLTSAETLTVRSNVTDVIFTAFGKEITNNKGVGCNGRVDIDGSTNAINTDIQLCTFSAVNQVDFLVCNRNAADTVDILIKVCDSVTPADEDRVIKYTLLPNQTMTFSLDINVANGYYIFVQSDTANVNFQSYTRNTTEFQLDAILPSDVILYKARESGCFSASADHDPGLNAAIQFNSYTNNNGVEFDAANYRWKLHKDKTYLLIGSARGLGSSSGYCAYQFYDETAAAVIGYRGLNIFSTYTGNSTANPLAQAIITPATDRYVRLRHIAESNFTHYVGIDLSVSIVEIGNLTEYVKNPYQVDFYEIDISSFVTGTSWTTVYAKANFYKEPNGQWYVDATIEGSYGGTSPTISINCLTFSSSGNQVVKVITNTSYYANGGTAVASTSNIALTAASSSTTWRLKLDGIRLAAKPTCL